MSESIYVFQGDDGVWRPSPGLPHANPPSKPDGTKTKRGVCGERAKVDDVFSADVSYQPEAPRWGWVDAAAWPSGA